MNFTVEWQPEADDQLAAAWTAAANRGDVTAAARRVERRLGYDPLTAGEDRGAGARLLFDRPLTVLFQVDEPGRMVRVVSVGLVAGA